MQFNVFNKVFWGYVLFKQLYNIYQHIQISAIYLLPLLQISGENQVEQQTEQQQDLKYEDQSGYKIPDKINLEQVLQADQNDDSLTRYKNALINQQNIVKNEKHVIFTKLSIVQDNKEQIFDFKTLQQIDNQGNVIKQYDSQSPLFTVHPGSPFYFKFSFNVYNDIVMGLRTVMKVTKAIFPIAKGQQMFGCFAPGINQEAKTEEILIQKSKLFSGKFQTKFAFGDDDEGDGAFGNLSFSFQVL